MTPAGSSGAPPPAAGPRLGFAWLARRLVPLGLLGAAYAVRLRELDVRGEDRVVLAIVGFGALILAGACWELRRRFPAQETIAGAARVVTIVAVVLAVGITAGAGGE